MITQIKVGRGLSKKKTLKSLGFTIVPRWEVVSPVIKKLIIRARRNGDIGYASHLSEIQSNLKRCLRRTCPKCGVAIAPRAIFCGVHTSRHAHS